MSAFLLSPWEKARATSAGEGKRSPVAKPRAHAELRPDLSALSPFAEGVDPR